MSDSSSFESSRTKVGVCSLSYIAILVCMDFLHKCSLDCPNNSIRPMGLVLLYFDLDDVHLHRRLVQGKRTASSRPRTPRIPSDRTFQVFSASALAGLGLIRNVAGAGFPLFGQQMFTYLGNQWAASLLAFLAILLIPIPFILERNGRALRLRSPWAKQHMVRTFPARYTFVQAIRKPQTLSRDSHAPPESIMLTWRNSTG